MKLELKEVAKSLDLPQGTVERWIRQGRIPIQKRNDLCMFNKAVLKKWAKMHNLSCNLSETPDQTEPDDDQVPDDDNDNLLSSMKRGGLLVDVPGNDAEFVFRYVVGRIPELSTENKDALIERLLQREELVSTGIGKGVAVPHPRSPMPEAISESLVITCVLAHPIDFKSIDDQPVSVLFFLLSPSISCHLNLLSRLSFCLRDNAFVSTLKALRDKHVLFEKIELIEKQADGKG
ncbi:MAG: PTS sugar transporter subunit IIA [Proteobacteria bacterium]|nr:PTS sugar transporter subunit IIA [Pseudomonadota bacterium]